ncbi:MAG: efflux RND transporter periplasmic adaptor subunit [Hydrogenophaga sp.]|uniref:efflux RND transporter periplasmic adaptor subunit n=1 Tax=Hydrogenophaga sp. TaxID=1904254 RepID=UPI001DE99988|nr:efflux RND transporter periplasmic adaptor subunit [Hydrogenophaga sp.]MBX3609901.1 efflux RND transporter periplasmic adaptor subunit [Hydrogenophaga sp.]
MHLSSDLPRRGAVISVAALTLAAVLTACGKTEAPAQAGGGAPPPAEVGVVTIHPGDVGLVNELPGRLEASRVAEVRARAAGILQRRLFREGSEVKAGQRLFQIDSAPYAAALQSARATLARAEANLTQATALAERYAPLVKENAISAQEYANAVAAQKQAEADVAAGRAAVRTADINLGYANVTAPIDGRIGRSLVTEGALVGQGEATQLAVIQQINPMYVNFTQSASEVYRLRRAFEAGSLKGAGSEVAKVRVVMEDGSVYKREGRLLFSDLTVDSTTGQVTLRAEVPNPDGVLLPGLYVRVRLEQATASNAVLLPQQAVTRSAQADTVMVVDGEGKVASRNVTLGGEQDGQWVVVDGLKPGEQVMVDGFQKLRPGATVKPVPWKKPGEAAAPSTSS